MRAENLMIVQGGGPTAVFNASLAGVIAQSIHNPKMEKVFGARSGMKGLAEANILDLSSMTAEELRTLRNSPGAALGSSRFKPTEDDLDSIVKDLRRLDIRRLIFLGGNGTMRGAEVVREFCRKVNLEVQIIGVPKTVDNDIAATDRCPGYASAARYIAQSTIDLGADIRSLPQPVTILETMGRNVGWLAAASTLAKVREVDAPHLVYLPEIPFYKDKFLADLDDVVSRQGWAIVVVSEGIRDKDGSLIYELTDPSQTDPLKRPMTGGVAQFLASIVGENLKIRCRSEKPGLLCRASMAHVSVQDQSDAELVGRKGVLALLAGESDKMVALRSLEEMDQCKLVPLSEAACIDRAIPTEWLTNDPLAVSTAFQNYARPLVGELCHYSPVLSSGLQSMGAF